MMHMLQCTPISSILISCMVISSRVICNMGLVCNLLCKVPILVILLALIVLHEPLFQLLSAASGGQPQPLQLFFQLTRPEQSISLKPSFSAAVAASCDAVCHFNAQKVPMLSCAALRGSSG